MGNYILSHKRQVLTFFVSVMLSVLLVSFYAVGASLIDTDNVGVGTTTITRAGLYVNEGFSTLLSGPAYVYGQLTIPYLVATSTANASTSTLSHINIDSNTFIVDKSNRIAIATTTFGSINDETMTIQAGSATASTTMYLGGSAAMLILRTTDGQDCAAISVKQASIVAGGAANNGTLSVDVITCPTE